MSYSASIPISNTAPSISDYQMGFVDTLSACQSILKENKHKKHSLASEIRDGVGDTAVTLYISKVETAQSNDTCASKTKLKTVQFNTPVNVNSQKTVIANPQNTICIQGQCAAKSEDTTLSNDLTPPPPQQFFADKNIAETVQIADIHIQTKDKSKQDSREIDIGKVVGNRYEILTEIARGGFGIVYRARQIGLDRVVALKRLHSQTDLSNIKRFFLEANIIKDLVHPNTIQLIDAGTDEDHLYLVMEYIEGQSLRDLIRHEHELAPLRALNITKQILKSLHEAHERGIIHRDIKPSNILIRKIIGEQDFVKVLDFGIAKAQFSHMPRLTQSGKILGTPQYLAPELLYGDEATAATDIFSVGLLLVEMLTGKPLLPKSPAEIVKLSTSRDPLPIPQWILLSPMGKLVQRALNKDPDMRYPNVYEMLEDIQKIEVIMLAESRSTKLNLTSIAEPTKPNYSLAAIAAAVIIINAVLLVLQFV